MDRERLRLSQSQIDTAEMKNLNEKRKAENGIIIFNDRDSTVGELRNPEDIGVAEMKMHLARFVITCHNDVIDAGQSNRLFFPCTDIDRERLRLSHAKRNVLRTNM
jgi:hypothetical protein